eukprot:Rmarinus@m.25344
MPSQEKKAAYFEKLSSLLDDYDKFFIVGCDNVGSKQVQDIRKALRGRAHLLMGKNTMIRKVLRAKIADKPELEQILPFIKENIGFVFTSEDLVDIRDVILEYKVGAPARVGAIAPCNVVVAPGPTGMEPQHTSYFQALGIATKINKGQIEIIAEVQLIDEGNKVSASQASLLQKLNMMPFHYGLVPLHVYEEGSFYNPRVLDLTDDNLAEDFLNGVRSVAAVSLACNYPTMASFPHSIVAAYKAVLGVALACEEYSFPLADKIKEALANPQAFAAAAPAAAAAGGDAPAAAAPAAAESEEESDDDMGFGLFD